jgi:hypothetical protein
VADGSVSYKTIINSNEYDFNIDEGLLKGNEYRFKVRAKNFYTHYYS